MWRLVGAWDLFRTREKAWKSPKITRIFGFRCAAPFRPRFNVFNASLSSLGVFFVEELSGSDDYLPKTRCQVGAYQIWALGGLETIQIHLQIASGAAHNLASNGLEVGENL